MHNIGIVSTNFSGRKEGHLVQTIGNRKRDWEDMIIWVSWVLEDSYLSKLKKKWSLESTTYGVCCLFSHCLLALCPLYHTVLRSEVLELGVCKLHFPGSFSSWLSVSCCQWEALKRYWREKKGNIWNPKSFMCRYLLLLLASEVVAFTLTVPVTELVACPLRSLFPPFVSLGLNKVVPSHIN